MSNEVARTSLTRIAEALGLSVPELLDTFETVCRSQQSSAPYEAADQIEAWSDQMLDDRARECLRRIADALKAR